MMPVDNYWKLEIRRMLLVILCGAVLGYITGYWQACFLLVGSAYIGWTLYKLRELQIWLTNEQPLNEIPDSDGVWEQIAYLAHKGREKSEARKKKHTELMSRFNSIMSALPDASILLDENGVIQWSNLAALNLLGISDSKDYGQRVDNLVRVPALTELLASTSDKEIRFVSPRNEKVTLSAQMFLVQPKLYLLSVRDISQSIQLTKMRRAFIANASHELRTPLTVLTGYLELFEDDDSLPEYTKPAIQQAQQQAFRMEQIITDLLELSRLESPELQHSKDTEIDVPALLTKLKIAIEDTIANESHTLSLKVDTNLKIHGHEKDITSVINNLLENAVKYTPAGSHIRIEWKRHLSGDACLKIEDNGPGIPAEHISRLTERFYRVDKGRSRSQGGTGLGLAIVKHVMMNHNGQLSIKSKPGKTRFLACFPADVIA